MKNLIDIKDLSVDEIEELIKVAKDIMQNSDKYSEKCKYKKMATLFFEPSTRTRLSFEAAMMELGGNVLGFSEASSSSTSKGRVLFFNSTTSLKNSLILLPLPSLNGWTLIKS